MARERFQTLTEQMFYTLLCLKEERNGMEILDLIPEKTQQRVNIGSGTLYTLLDQFSQEGMIRETRREGRSRYYIITEEGRDKLKRECFRLMAQLKDYQEIFGEEGLL